MILHLIKTCSAFDYKDRIEIKSYKIDKKFNNNVIIIELKDTELIIPINNIICIEEK